MCLKGLDFRAIARVLGIGVLFVIGLKHLALNIKTLNNANLNQNDESIDRVELDEIHSDAKFKNYRWSWTAIGGYTKQVLGFVCGRRDTKTFKRLYDKLNTDNIKLFCFDYCKAYQERLPKSKHIQSKTQIFTIECYNGRI